LSTIKPRELIKMNLLTQNNKIRKTAKHFDVKLFNFSIPAYKSKSGFTTCPSADICVKFCYARKGAYPLANKWSELKLQETLKDSFIQKMNKEIKDKKAEYIRVHDSGDYYSKEYLLKWFEIAVQNPSIKFYSYTNNINMIKNLKSIPINFDFIFSDSGKERKFINKKTDRHTKIFGSLKALKKANYKDSSEFDLYATRWYNESNNVGLIIH
tara:strand:- start:774 stop:1409 length:636 start_codon:yes stop_codon:yes gene_type:complete